MFETGQRVKFTTGPLGALGSDAEVNLGEVGTVIHPGTIDLPNDDWRLVSVLRPHEKGMEVLLVPVHLSMIEES
jgi:hypothetical protein